MSTDSSTDRTNVYAFINGGTPLENLWVAIAEDGDVLAVGYVLDPELAAIFGAGEAADGPTHVGPTGPGRDRYIEKFGDDPESAINYVVVPDGELPPEVVLESATTRRPTRSWCRWPTCSTRRSSARTTRRRPEKQAPRLTHRARHVVPPRGNVASETGTFGPGVSASHRMTQEEGT